MSRAPSFLGALKETVRAVFVDDPPDKDELFKLAKQHRFAEVEELLRCHPQSWHVKDESGHSLLHWAALGGNLAFATAALVAGVHPDVRGGLVGGEQTPLMWAVSGSRAPVPLARALLAARADPMAREARHGATALMLAVQQERFEPLPLLVETGGAELLAAGDHRGCTAIDRAAYEGHLQALAALEALGADLAGAGSAAAGAGGLTPLHHAVWAYRPEVVEFLVERGADPMRCTRANQSCVDIADAKGNPGLRSLLLAAMLKRLLAQWPLRPSSPKSSRGGSSGKDAAEALQLRDIAAATPLALGVAASWSEAWAARGGNGEGAEVGAGVGEATRDESHIVMDCTSFDLDYANSLEKLREALVRRAADARTVLRKELLACFVVTDRHGAPVNLLAQSKEELPADLFPLRAQLAGLREVGSNELNKLEPVICVGVSYAAREEPELFQHRVLTRIPAAFRWSVWKEVLRLRERELPRGGEYLEMGARENEWTQLILNDIGRTFTFFDRQQQQSLQRMLNAYAVMNPEVGYCQGMNMIGGLLLLLSDSEEECFGVLACLMDQIGLAEFYRDGFPLLRHYLSACDELMAQSAPELLQHFAKEGVELSMYLQQWFLTLFIDCLPLPLVLAIWDAIICEGLPVALKVVVTILTSLEEPLRAMRFQEIATSFKTMRKHLDRKGEWQAFEAGHLLVRQASQVQVPASILEEHRKAAAAVAAAAAAGGGRVCRESSGRHEAGELCFM